MISNHAYGYIDSDYTTVSANTRYQALMYVRNELDPDDSAGCWTLRIQYFTSANADNGYKDVTNQCYFDPVRDIQWRQVGGVFTTPANTASVKFRLFSYMNSGWVAFDDVELHSAPVATKYYYFGGQRIAQRVDGVLQYLRSDHLGSTTLTTDSSGNSMGSQTYRAYGSQRGGDGVPTENQFTGQKQDGSGLQYFAARYYDPQTGLFVSPDTIVPDAGNVFAYNRSMYTVGNPLKYRDPTGHWLETGLDIISLGYTVNDINENGLNWENGIGLVADVGSLVLPGVAGGGTIVRHADDAYAAGKAGANAAWDWGKKMLGYGDDAAQAVNTVCSFSEETLVATSEGLKPISTLKIGDLVLAFNESTGETDYYPILDTFSHNDPQLVFLTIDGETITTTPEHPFYEAETAPWLVIGEFRYNWTPAEGLKVGDFVRSADGTLGQVAKVEIVDRQQVMYNLTVAEAHTFFVGQEQWLVHNSCTKAFVNGSVVSASKLGTELAEGADELFAVLNRNEMSAVTVAVGVIDGKTTVAINSGAPMSAVNKIFDAATAKGWDFVPHTSGIKQGAGHAEQILHNHSGGKLKSIGVSHVTGPCDKFCQPHFNGTGVEIAYTGKYK